MRTCLVNARCLTKYISGIGRYTFALLDAMANEDADLQFILDRSPKGFFTSLLERKNISLGTDSTVGIAKIEADVYWSPVPRTPLFARVNCPTVITVHDLAHLKYPETMTLKGRLGSKVFFDRAIKGADKITCVSNSTKQDLFNSYSLPEDKVSVVHPIVKMMECELLDLIGSSYILFVGTFEPRKNIERLLYAYSMYLDRCFGQENPKLVLAGSEGWGNVNVRNIIKSLNLEGYVYVYERPEETTLHSLYKYCRFLVYPSLYEGFGIPILEALNFQKPVLTSNRYSMPEVAGNAGLYVDPNSVEEIADGIFKLDQEKGVRVAKSRYAKARAKHFSGESSSQKMLDILLSVI